MLMQFSWMFTSYVFGAQQHEQYCFAAAQPVLYASNVMQPVLYAVIVWYHTSQMYFSAAVCR